MAFLNKGRSIAVVEEVSYGAATPTFANSDYVDYTGSDLSTSIENLERNVVRNSMVALEPVLGQETSSGSITVEISGDNATTGVNGHLLYKNGIGKFINNTTATTATAGTVTSITVSSVTGLVVGQVVKVNLTTGDEYSVISAIAGSVLTVEPAFTAAPSTGDAVAGLATYILPKPSDTIASLAVRENLKPQSGTPIDYDYLGVVVSDVALSYPVGNIATSQFTVAGAGFTVDNTGTTPVLPCTVAKPVVGKNAILSVMGTNYAAQDLSINVTTEIADINSITTDGLSNKLATGKGVTGSFKVEYTGATSFEAFKAGTTGSLMLKVRDGGKTAPMLQVVYMPSVKFTEVSRSEDSGVMYDNINFQAMSPDCGEVERALSIAFA
jgi:hypothetical protein